MNYRKKGTEQALYVEHHTSAFQQAIDEFKLESSARMGCGGGDWNGLLERINNLAEQANEDSCCMGTVYSKPSTGTAS